MLKPVEERSVARKVQSKDVEVRGKHSRKIEEHKTNHYV